MDPLFFDAIWFTFKTICLSMLCGAVASIYRHFIVGGCNYPWFTTFALYTQMGVWICAVYLILCATYGCPCPVSPGQPEIQNNEEIREIHPARRRWVDTEESETTLHDKADTNNTDVNATESTIATSPDRLDLRAVQSDQDTLSQQVSEVPVRQGKSDPQMTQQRCQKPCRPVCTYDPTHQLWIPTYQQLSPHTSTIQTEPAVNSKQGRKTRPKNQEVYPRSGLSESPQSSTGNARRDRHSENEEQDNSGTGAGILVVAAAIGLAAHLVYHAVKCGNSRPQELVNQAANCAAKTAKK